MWTCKKCNSIIEEDDFDICWNCQNQRVDINLGKVEIHNNDFKKNKMKIILSNNSEQSENNSNEHQKETIVKPNLFQGRTEAEKGSAKFPDWDIVPPNQFINPRIKTK